VCWHTRKTWLRVVAFGLVSLIAVAAGFSRMYRGMHHLTDVGAGVLMGIGALAVLVFVARASRAAARTRDASEGGT